MHSDFIDINAKAKEQILEQKEKKLGALSRLIGNTFRKVAPKPSV
jgi:hypothetical protein